MRKIGRNEPCPCGSGKKYKRCCGSHPATNVDAQTINQNLFKLHQQLVSSISTKYQHHVDEWTNFYSKSKALDDETAQIYKTGLIPWIISHTSYTDGSNETILDDFINSTIIPLHTKEYFSKWAKEVPSIYEVVAIGQPTKEFAMIKEIQTERVSHIPYDASNELIEGSLLIGTLVPHVHYDNFLYTMIKLYNREVNPYIDLLNQYNNSNGGMGVNFPDFLMEALTTGADQQEWDAESYEQVAQQFVNHMIEKNVDDEAISNGVLLWKQYSNDEKPIIKKVEAYAAALDYFVQREFANTEQTQGHLADEYDISPGTISKIYRNFMIYNESRSE